MVYRWGGYEEGGAVRSILCYVDEHGERLREKYIAWIHALGEAEIDGRRLIDHLAFEDGLSFWWVTPFVEQSPWKTPVIIDAIRLFALEEVLSEQAPEEVCLVSADKRLHHSVRELCRNMDIAYHWRQQAEPTGRRFGRSRAIRIVPHTVRALLYLLFYALERWPLRQSDRAGWFGGGKALLFCSYFINISDPGEGGQFYSRYWQGLHRLLQQMGLQANWLHMYLPHAAVSKPATALKWLSRFNHKRQEQGFHTLIDAYLSWSVLLRVLKRWIWLAAATWRLRSIKHAFKPAGTHLSLWPLMRGEWYAAMRGKKAVESLLFVELFDAALGSAPRQRKGFYLLENQAWERAFVHAWKKHAHGELVGVQHTTIRFWDLRYFVSPSTLCSTASHPIPQPGCVALNGKMAVNACLEMGLPKKMIRYCEALRFEYLKDVQANRLAPQATRKEMKILILGDHTRSGTERLLRMLEGAYISSASYSFKAHPSFTIQPEKYPLLHLKTVTDSLGRNMNGFDIACATHHTSASLDAFLSGLRIVVLLDENEPNFSPLRGQPNVRFVCSAEELIEALQHTGQDALSNPVCDDFFFLDRELPRWKRLLEVV